MKNFILVLAALVVAPTLAMAADMGIFGYESDRSGRNDFVMFSTLYTNEAVAGPTAVSATCPAAARLIKFDPGVSGDFRIKANGSGTPGSTAVADGTGWRNNVAELLPINSSIGATLISSYAVYSTVASNTVPYACYAK